MLAENIPQNSRFDAIPSEMRERRRWVLWNLEPREDKPGEMTKVPYQVSGRKAMANSPKTWNTFDAVLARYEAGGYSGIGFVFQPGDRIRAFDFDKVLEPETGILLPWAADVVTRLDSYTEISQSGQGLHVICYSEMPEIENLKKRFADGSELEMATTKYFAMTGQMLPGANPNIADRDAEVYQVCKKYLGIKDDADKKATTASRELTFDLLLKQIRASKQGALFEALFSGDTSKHKDDDSAADLALCNILAWWCKGDAALVDTIFRQSGLYRQKWERADYRNKTIDKAVAAFHDSVRAGFTEMPRGDSYFDSKGQFRPVVLTDDILRSQRFAMQKKQLYCYRDGCYVETSQDKIKAITKAALGERYRDSRGLEVAKQIETDCWRQDDVFTNDLAEINVKNGILNWRTGEIREHTPDYLSRVQIPVIYDPGVDCPRTKAFFREVLHEDCLDLAAEVFGYCLIPDVSMQKAFLLKSNGESGKSVFLDLIKTFLGSANVSHESLQAISENRFRAASLYGKLANIFADIPSSYVEDASTFKALVTGDSISAEKKGRDPFNIENTARLLFSANELPRSADSSHGYFRRWCILTFPNSFPPGHPSRDENLLDKLTTPAELSGLLNLALEGLRRLKARGYFNEPISCKTELLEYQRINDSCRLFCEERVELKPQERVERTSLFSAYRYFCFEENTKPVSCQRFYAKLREIFPQVAELKSKGIRYVEGIGFK